MICAVVEEGPLTKLRRPLEFRHVEPLAVNTCSSVGVKTVQRKHPCKNVDVGEYTNCMRVYAS